MRTTWRLPEVELSRAELEGRRIESVLVEFDGPEIASVWGLDGERRLSVACDEVASAVRWVEAALSPQQWRDLFEGRLTIREGLQQAEVWIVDQTIGGDALHGWRMSSLTLTDDVLPEPGALLPTETRRRFAMGPRAAPAELSERDAQVSRGSPAMPRMVA